MAVYVKPLNAPMTNTVNEKIPSMFVLPKGNVSRIQNMFHQGNLQVRGYAFGACLKTVRGYDDLLLFKSFTLNLITPLISTNLRSKMYMYDKKRSAEEAAEM